MLAGIGDVASIIAIVEFIPKLCKLVDNLRKHKKTKAEIRVKCGSLLEKLKDLDDKIGEINNMNPKPKLEDDLKKITSDLGKISTLFEKRPARSLRRIVFCRKVEQLFKGPSTMQKLDEAIGLLDSHISNMQLVIDIRAQMPKFSKSLPAIPAEIVGFSRVKMILDFLGETEVGVEVRVVAVCGEGGLGKTTLLKWTLRELQKQKNNAFCMSYVEVGMHADDEKLKDLQSSIIEQLGGPQMKLQSWGHGHTEMVQQIGKMKRTNTQFCLAIDNVWERKHLSRLVPGNLGSCLPSSSYILLTTRSKEVVDELRLLCKKETPTSTSCAQSRCKFYDYDPSMLAETDAKELFRKHACLEEGKEQPLVDKMVERCQGLPLALEIWGKVFAKEEKRIRWKDIVKKVPKDVKDVLQLSYEELSPEAQKAFLNIVSFFEGWEWSIVSCIVGGDELEELESRSLLKPDYRQNPTCCWEFCPTIRGPSPIKHVKIHDLIFEMGNDVAKSQGNRLTRREWIQEHAHNSQELHKIEGIWQNRWGQEEVGGDVLGKMQSLRILRTKVGLLDQCPPLATSLQCLDLDCNSGAWEMPIGKYTNMSLLSLRRLHWDFNRAQFPYGLRQLYLHGCHGLVELPSNSFRELRMLEVLHLHDCRLLERLPTTMGTLQELRELVIAKAPHFQELTPSVLTDLTKMRLLCLWGCLCLTDLPDVEWNLSKLTTLRLQECERLTATSVPSSALTSLETVSLEQMHHLEVSPSDLAELHVLKKLSYAGCKNMSSLPETLGKLTLLECLDLRDCQSLTCLPETIGNLTLLERLDLTGCQSLTCLPETLGKLTLRERLDLVGCQSLTCLPETLGKLTLLERLDLVGCESLTCLPETLGNLTLLECLDLRDCQSLTCLPETLGNLTLLGKLNIFESLGLMGCQSLTCLPETIGNLTLLERLDLSGCQSLTCLPKTLGKLTLLERLDLRGCQSLTCLPETLGKLTLLERLDLTGCQSLTCLPETLGNLTLLEHLDLTGCQSLASVSGNLTLLKHLDLTGCQSFTCLPETLGNLTLLERLDLTGCQSLTCLPETLGNLTLLQRLDLRGCQSLTCLPGSALGKLVQLKQLKLAGCSSLARLPVEVGQLKQLRVLRLDGCNNMTEDVQLEILGGLESLQRLSLRDCHSLVTLPDCAVQSKMLEELDLSGCRELLWLPRSITDASSLTWLSLGGCVKLSELPKDMGNLKALRFLVLSDCEELQELPGSIGGIAGLDVTVRRCRRLVDLPQAISGKPRELEQVMDCSMLTQLPPQLWAAASFASSCSSNIDHVLEFLASVYGLTGLTKDAMTPSTLNSIREQAVPQLERLTLAWKHTGDEAMEEEWLGMLRKATSLTYLDITLDLGETGGKLLYKTVEAMKALRSLKSSHLRISGGRCELPVEVWTLRHLSLKGTIIFNLPQMLPAGLTLISLELQKMSDLQVLPPQIKHLSNLRNLTIRSCAALVSLSPEIGLLKKLICLDLQWCASLQELPLKLCNLRSLSTLNLEGCASLQELPLKLCNLISLRTLNLKGCTSLTHLPKSLCRLPHLKELKSEECWGLSMEKQNLDIMAPWIHITKKRLNEVEKSVDKQGNK